MGIDIAGAPGRIAVEIRFGSNYGFGLADSFISRVIQLLKLPYFIGSTLCDEA